MEWIISNLRSVSVWAAIFLRTSIKLEQYRFKWNTQHPVSLGTVSEGFHWSSIHIIAFEGIIVIKLVVLYGCETWSLTFREERMLRVFENRVLRRIFGP